MKLDEFQFYFPNADMNMFKELEGSVVWGKYNDDIEEPSFWDNDIAVFDLHLDFNEYASYYEDKEGFFRKFKMRKRFHSSVQRKSNFPLEWDISISKTPEDITLKLQDIDFNKFRIYVSSKDFFMLNDTLPDFSDITKIDLKDSKNVYCLSLKAMYVLSYIGGMSLQNLQSENNLAKSLAYFYFYYHLKKFYNYRDFTGYDTSPVEKMNSSLYEWAHHFVWYHPQIHYTKESLKRTKDDIVENIHRDGKKLRYDTRLKKRDVSKDYLKLISNKGKGLTRIGQRLLQESNQAYVYCVLGAQAKTRWKIIGDGANSYQTQTVFKSLVNEVLTQNNLSLLIKSMRLAVQQTRVRLDFVISPGLEILPSKMVYIEDSPGYNNLLLVSGRNLKFGENNNVNTSRKLVTSPKTTAIATYNDPPKDSSPNAPILISAGLLAIIGRLIWVAII